MISMCAKRLEKQRRRNRMSLAGVLNGDPLRHWHGLAAL